MTIKNTLLTLLAATISIVAHADNFRMKTPRTDFCISVDAGINVTLTWSDGTRESYLSEGVPYLTSTKTEDVSITTDAYVRNLYLAGNEATLFDAGNLPRIEVLDLSGNDLADVNLQKLTTLESLLINGNRLTALDLAKQTRLRKLHASGNELVQLTLNMSTLTDLWMDGNHLTGTLDLTKQAHLHSLNVAANAQGHLDHILLSNASTAKAELDYADVSGNHLFYNSFPTVYDKQNQKTTVINRLDPQYPYHYTDYFLPNEQYDITDLIRYNAWGTAIAPTVELYRMTKKDDYTISTDNLLVKGTDYTTVGSYKYTFLTEHPRVFFRVTSDLYPSLALVTEPFAITSDPSSIKTFTFESENAGTSYDLQGRSINSPSHFREATGLYIQNGKKVIIK